MWRRDPARDVRASYGQSAEGEQPVAQSKLHQRRSSGARRSSEVPYRQNGVVVWLAHGHEGGGVGRSLLSIRQALASSGLDVHLLSLSAGPLTDLAEQHGVPVAIASPSRIVLAAWDRCPDGILTPAAFALSSVSGLGRAVQRRLSQVGWDPIVAVHVRTPALIPVGGRISREAGVPLIWQIANAPSRASRARRTLYRLGLRRWRVKAIANSRYVRDQYAFLGPLPYAYVPIEAAFRTADLDQPSELPLRFLSIGRVSPLKGQRILVAAFEDYKRRDGTGVLRIVGLQSDEASSADLRRQVADSPWRATIELVDYVADPIACYEDSHIVLAGQVVHEPFGQTAAQGLLLGRPVLAIGAGGPAELVASIGFGWHAPSFARRTIAQWLRTAERDYSTMVSRAPSARDTARRLLDPCAFVHTYEQTLTPAPPPAVR